MFGAYTLRKAKNTVFAGLRLDSSKLDTRFYYNQLHQLTLCYNQLLESYSLSRQDLTLMTY
jgi:hypothetical protein